MDTGSTELRGLTAALHELGVNVLVTDRHLAVVYINRQGRAHLAELAPKWGGQWGLDPHDLVGASLGKLKLPGASALAARMMEADAYPVSGEVEVAGRPVHFVANALRGELGELAGVVLHWAERAANSAAHSDPDRAAKDEEIQQELMRIRQMVDNAPTSIMMADLDCRIIYMNKASVNALAKIEHLLPVKAHEVLGQSIDIFHKRPEHQRRLLANPGNLPHRAEIKLGQETLDLLISPIYDPSGRFLGPMLTWEVITARLEAQARERQMVEQQRLEQESMRHRVDQMLGIVKQVREGDLTVAIPVVGSDPLGQVGGALNDLLSILRADFAELCGTSESLASAAEQLGKISSSLSSNAEQTSQQANTVSAASEQVSKNVSLVATATEEMLASIREIARSATDSAKLTEGAVRMAESTNSIVSKLGDSSAEIGNVIKVITSIAQQTNLLALNATIEAARAGEAGKGFAVVANEVKELAKQTARATEEIGQKIEAIQRDTDSAVGAIGEIGRQIGQISEFSSQIASAVEEQTATTNEMGRNIQEAALGSEDINRNIAVVAMAASETTAGASDTNSSASNLRSQTKRMRELLSKFKI